MLKRICIVVSVPKYYTKRLIYRIFLAFLKGDCYSKKSKIFYCFRSKKELGLMMAGNLRKVEKKEEAVFKKTFIRLERFIVESFIVSGIVLFAVIELTSIIPLQKKITKKLKNFLNKKEGGRNAAEN